VFNNVFRAFVFILFKNPRAIKQHSSVNCYFCMNRIIMRLFFLSLICFVFVASSYSASISGEYAEKIARNFYFHKTSSSQPVLYDNIVFSDQYEVFYRDEHVYSVFNLDDNQGFVIVSAIQSLPPVLGYEFKGRYNEPKIDGPLKMWVDAIKKRVINESKNDLPEHPEWKKYTTKPIIIPDLAITGVEPLLDTFWAERCFYNDSCPVDPLGYCNHAPVGCGGVAVSQILNYHEYPEHGYGSYSYEIPLYGTISVNFQNTYYDWNNMPETLDENSSPEEVAAVSQLMFHSSVAIESWFEHYSTYSSQAKVRDAFVQFFNYHSGVQLISQEDFQDSTWKQILKSELDAQRPFFYYVSEGSGGHFVVCDGYEADDYFHFNWGRLQAPSRWRYLEQLWPVQEAVVNIRPADGMCNETHIFRAKYNKFDEGSNSFDYSNNMDCEWLISHPDANRVSLVFSSFDTEYNKDFLYVYDGNDASAPLLGIFCGSRIPPMVQSTGPEMFLRFVTNESNTRPGWSALYVVDKPALPHVGMSILTDPSGSFSDGSDTANYVDNTVRMWLIDPEDASSVNLSFINFETEDYYDYVEVFSGDNIAPENLLGHFTDDELPPSVYSPTGKMLVIFLTDVGYTMEGWDASYTSNQGRFLDVDILLEGPFNGLNMNVNLYPSSIPLSSPFMGFPWYYSPSEELLELPPNPVVDWVLIEIRETPFSADSANMSTIAFRKAAFLLSNGNIRDLDGTSPLVLDYEPTDNLYVAVFHRNHLGVLSSQPMNLIGNTYLYDFTDDASKAYGGASAVKEISPGLWGMVAGDGNSDGDVSNPDKNEIWNIQAGMNGYYQGDFNLNSEVGNPDKNDLWIPNSGRGMQMPDN